MSRPATIFVVDGHVVRKLPADWDGTALVEKKRRRKYLVMSEPYLMTEKAAIGTRAVNVFFVSTQTSTTWDAETMRRFVQDVRRIRDGSKAPKPGKPKKGEPAPPPAAPADAGPEEEVEGVTVPAPAWASTVIDIDPATGDERPYRVTPEYIFEQSDSSDVRAWNQQQGTNKTMLWLAAGAGAAGMVMLYFVFQLVKGTSFFGHSG